MAKPVLWFLRKVFTVEKIRDAEELQRENRIANGADLNRRVHSDERFLGIYDSAGDAEESDR